MNYDQNYKISQITEKTLVVGVDIAKSKHYARAFDWRGMEPTGHYWFTFAADVDKKGMMVVQVNPYHVKQSKELDDNTPSKNDRKDPRTIAMLVKDGRYLIPYFPKGIYAELRKAYEIRESQLKKKWAIKNRVIRWLDIYFPEFTQVFKSWEGKAALMTLEKFALPREMIELGAEKILAIWRQEVKRAVGIKELKQQ